MDRLAQTRAGIVSVTFRHLSTREVVQLVKESGLSGIEWGGDHHVPPGNLKRARQTGELTRSEGLSVVSYGSYHNLGKSPGPDLAEWRDVVATALALGAPTIRIWAGTRGTALTSAGEYAAIVKRARAEAELARDNGLKVACEFHDNTLTDNGVNAARFLESVDHPSFGSLWQPMIGAPVEENIAALRLIGKWLSHVHVFHWKREGAQLTQCPLGEGKEAWEVFSREVQRHCPGAYHLLEFVRGADPGQFRRDAETLRELLSI